MKNSAGYSEVTALVHGDFGPRVLARTPNPPLQRSSTVLLPDTRSIYGGSGVTYGRGGLATHTALRDALAELEHAEHAFLFPSGLAAITGTLQALTSAGDEILVSDGAYNPTRRFLEGNLKRFGVAVRYFPADASADTVAEMVGPATRLIYLESPASLTFEMQDVPAIADMARRRNVLTAIDNTWAAGVLFKPLDHGVDVSIQALTKYVCGHSDVFMGSAAASGDCATLLAKAVHEVGWTVSADDAYLALRGLRTLNARLERHGASARTLAGWLGGQPEVAAVLSPSIADHPGHGLWRRDFSGQCGLFAFVLDAAPDADVSPLIDSLELFGRGFSWGGFESLAIHCNPQLQARMQAQPHAGPIVRLHVGLEDPKDLMGDLRRGLDRLAG